MVVELIGGPLDGALFDAPSHMPVYVIVSSHREGPVYKMAHCSRYALQSAKVPYYFLGYEEPILEIQSREKSPHFEAIEQLCDHLSDPETKG